MIRSGFAIMMAASLMACGSNDAENTTEVARARSGNVDVVLLAEQPALNRGMAAFTIEFHEASEAAPLVDAGAVKASAVMPMAGMAPMMASVDVAPTATAGRYAASTELTMVGEWRIAVEWDGPAGRGAATLLPKVQ